MRKILVCLRVLDSIGWVLISVVALYVALVVHNITSSQ